MVNISGGLSQPAREVRNPTQTILTVGAVRNSVEVPVEIRLHWQHCMGSGSAGGGLAVDPQQATSLWGRIGRSECDTAGR